MAYLFVHFKEKSTPDGEQVYFALSNDGFHWERINNGNPVLWSRKGEGGVRDTAIIRSRSGRYYIFAADLCLANNFTKKYNRDWQGVSRYGSKFLVMWESDDLIHWSEQKMLDFGEEDFGCLWSPDIIYDKAVDDYILYWTSTHISDNFEHKAIYYSRTSDFRGFTYPKMMYRKEHDDVVDSVIYEEHGMYFRFSKSTHNPARVVLEKSDTIIGNYERIPEFDKTMNCLEEPEAYQAAVAYPLADGRWCLMLDYYGGESATQGYIPFLTNNIESGLFERADKEFSFPYRFRNGSVIKITTEEYGRIKSYKEW